MDHHRRAIPSDERVGTLISAGILVAFGLFWIFQARQLPTRQQALALNSQFLPTWAGIILVAMAAILLVTYWRLPSRPARELGKEVLFPEPARLWRPLAGVLALLAYIVFLLDVHYAVSTFLLMLVALSLFGERPGLRLVLLAAAVSLVFFAVFVGLLSVPLPGSRYAQ